MNDNDLITALSFLNSDDRKMVEKIIELVICGKKFEVVEVVVEPKY